MDVDILEDPDRFAELKDEWNGLLRQSAADGIFLTWEWLSSWWRHLAEDRRLHILTVRRGRELVALAPFGVRPPGMKSALPFPFVEFLGSGSVGSDYLDVIIKRGREHRALRVMAAALARRKLLLELDHVRGNTAAALELAGLLARRGWSVTQEPMNECRFIPLAGLTFDSYLEGLGREHRYNFRRRLRQMGRLFEVRFEKVAIETGRPEALRQVMALHHARWRDRGISNAFHTQAHVAFHEEASRLACARGWLRIFLLHLDGRPAAGLYGFQYGGVFSFYQSGFDPAFGRYSVGLVTMGLAIRNAIEEGAREFDLLQGLERYKRLWAREARALSRVEVYPPLLRGSVYRGAVELSRAAKRAVRRVLSPRVIGRIVARRQGGPGQ